MSEVDKRYRQAMIELGGAGRFRRACSLFSAGRQIIEQRISRKFPNLSESERKKEVCKQLYRKDIHLIKLIDG